MEYDTVPYGDEIKDFNFIPQGLQENFSAILSEHVEIQPNTGIFRKPNESIHVEPFYQHCLWMCVVALENTSLFLHEQENIKTVFDVTESIDETQWTVQNRINMKKNDFVFVRPWLFYSLEKDKLVQIFLLNQQIEDKE